MDASQYPGYPPQYWYPQSHPTGHYANSYPAGSGVQPQYNPQVMPGYPNGHGVYNPPQTHDLHQGPIQILVAQQSKAVGPLGKHFPSTNIITILDLTVKGVQDILLELIHTTVKVVTTNCLQTLPILLASRFKARLLKLGHTLAHMPLHSSNGLLVNNLHKILMEIQCVLLILLHGQGRAQVHLRHTSPRNSAHHLLDQNPR
uniref:Uncharacterized protein n=1 Tax=Knipowitschia caucasica TaxID=637954 RepID=A0AAV2MSM8_KNICA